MAQEPDRLTADASPADAAPAQIERDIERTRADLTETIDALGARFEPAYLKEQAQEAIADTARSAGTSMIDTLKDNPLPAAIAGLSIAWLVANRSSGSAPRPAAARMPAYGAPAYGATYGGRGTAGRPASGGQTDGPSLVDQARDSASGVAQSVSGTASDLADQARDTASDVAQQAQHMADRAESWLEGQMHRNPLGVGAVVLAAGALVGLSLPATDAEQTLMGAPAARLVGQAKEAADGTLDQVREAASKVMGEVKEKASEVVETVQTEAKGLADPAGARPGGESNGGALNGGAPAAGTPGMSNGGRPA